MKYFPFFIFLLVLSTSAQNDLTGNVGTKEKVAIPYATVVTFKMPDSTFYKATATDEKGEFEFKDFQQGAYTFQISSIGYVTLSQKQNITGSGKIGDFYLAEDTEQLP
jgi:hypothetical protein